MMLDLNWIAVLAATLVAMVIGAVWYSPVMFAKPWMAALGKRPEELGSPIKAITNAMAMNLISAATLTLVLARLGVSTIRDGLITSLLIAVGLVLTNQLMRDRFHGASTKLSLINGANTVVVFLAMGAVISAL